MVSFRHVKIKNPQDCCWHAIFGWWTVINPAVKLSCACYTRQAPHTLPNVYCLNFTQLSKAFLLNIHNISCISKCRNLSENSWSIWSPTARWSDQPESSKCHRKCSVCACYSAATPVHHWPGWSNQTHSSVTMLMLHKPWINWHRYLVLCFICFKSLSFLLRAFRA